MSLKLFDETLLEGNEFLEKWIDIEDSIFSLTKSSFKETIEKISKNFDGKDLQTIYKIIIRAANLIPFSFKIYGDLFQELEKPKMRLEETKFTKYLKSRGIIDNECDVFNIEKYDNPFPSYSLESAIFNDDVDLLSNISSTKPITGNIVSFNSDAIDLLSFAAVCGSLQCFKYCLINNVEIDKKLPEFVIIGGNEEILELCFQKELDFGDCFSLAVKYHRNNIARWIQENFEIKNVSLTFCLESCNTLAFLYFLKQYLIDTRDEGLTPLIHAASTGYYPVVEFLISKGAKVDSLTQKRETPLMYAAKNGNIQVMELLLEKGADINKKNDDGYSALFFAAIGERVDSLEFLVSRGLSIESVDKCGNTILHAACGVKAINVAKFCLLKGIAVDARNQAKETPLYKAIESQGAEIVDFLLDNNADINVKDKDGRTPLMLAASLPQLSIIQSICFCRKNGRCNLSDKDKKDRNCVHYAAATDNVNVMSFLIDRDINFDMRDKFGCTPLMIATQANQINMVRYLIQIGCDIETKDKEGWTLIERAAHNGSLSIVSDLYQKGVDIDSKDKQWWTPLHRAAYNGHSSVVRFLINHNADYEIKNKKGKTALQIAQNDAVKQILSSVL